MAVLWPAITLSAFPFCLSNAWLWVSHPLRRGIVGRDCLAAKGSSQWRTHGAASGTDVLALLRPVSWAPWAALRFPVQEPEGLPYYLLRLGPVWRWGCFQSPVPPYLLLNQFLTIFPAYLPVSEGCPPWCLTGQVCFMACWRSLPTHGHSASSSWPLLQLSSALQASSPLSPVLPSYLVYETCLQLVLCDSVLHCTFHRISSLALCVLVLNIIQF